MKELLRNLAIPGNHIDWNESPSYQESKKIHRLIGISDGYEHYFYKIRYQDSVQELIDMAAPHCKLGFTVKDMVDVLLNKLGCPDTSPLLYIEASRMRKPFKMVADFHLDDIVPMNAARYETLKREWRNSVRSTRRFEKRMAKMEEEMHRAALAMTGSTTTVHRPLVLSSNVTLAS